MKEVRVIMRLLRRLLGRAPRKFGMTVEKDRVPPSPISDRELFVQLQSALIESGLFLQQDCSREDLMSLVGVNKNRIGSIVRNGGGYASVTTYLNSLRLDYAIELRRSHPEKNMKEIAEDSGFDSFQNFNRSFKERFSDTPYHYFRTIFS